MTGITEAEQRTASAETAVLPVAWKPADELAFPGGIADTPPGVLFTPSPRVAPDESSRIMNYPIWDISAGGLLIAAVAIVHVFVSHFAVGGGLFLVLLEWKARRERNDDLLGYVRKHSLFFVLLTLVFGAITGVGIWFTISLVNPQATSSLIQIFVWVWAIEWTFFLTEIAAAMVYYYGWDRLSARAHLGVGWIYFVSAWLSLFAINGILSFMLTPGRWVEDASLLAAFLNPTFWPSLLIRTAIATGLAGLYCLLTVSWMGPASLKGTVSRYASLFWIIPSMAVLPAALMWYLERAAGAGVPVGTILGVSNGDLAEVFAALFSAVERGGYPIAQNAALLALAACIALILITLVIAVWRSRWLNRATAGIVMVLGLTAFAGAEFVREDLRKPYVLGRLMFVNGVRLPAFSAAYTGPMRSPDPFSIEALRKRGVLESARWIQVQPSHAAARPENEEILERGEQLFKLLCSSCHTLHGYLAISPLVQGVGEDAIENVLRHLAEPVDPTGKPTSWSDPELRILTWRGRRMPPFAGTDSERRALAHYLASLSGPASGRVSSLGQRVFEQKCIFCHGAEADWNLRRMAPTLDAGDFLARIKELPSYNPIMPPFEGTEEEGKALAQYLAQWVRQSEEKRQ